MLFPKEASELKGLLAKPLLGPYVGLAQAGEE